MNELDELVTESRDLERADLDLRPTREVVALMAAEDASVPPAVAAAGDEIAAAIDAVAARLAAGGRLIYAGAGTSGRVAALDAEECEATFSVEPGRVVAIVAADDAAEDDREGGARDVADAGACAADAVVVLSASGRTPYALGALERAAALGALTVAVVAAEGSELAGLADHAIVTVVGPELVAGSTRLKAGTAQKLVLNMLSTISMIRLGKTFGNLMVDVRGSNEKLRARARRIVVEVSGVTEPEADDALDAAAGSAKVAILSLLAGIDAAGARARLDAVGGNLRQALLP